MILTIKRSFDNIKIGGVYTISQEEVNEQIAAQNAKQGTPEAAKLKKIVILSKSTGASPATPGSKELKDFMGLWFSKGEPVLNGIVGDPWNKKVEKGKIYVSSWAFWPEDLELQEIS
ncbi:hypothetical protein KKG29_04535 [Patescibacteria group bacterium]|nr:hypothetical protein [Patescibacteria group bacterium]MBU4000405.1 hypothetical protein [Patescibacteria group bacterium]MBU4056473.1 hypothetical protein [Patescibacteria group bacterium]MBU4368541.1 hypothetical protein [Patescibacteria group bacterium]